MKKEDILICQETIKNSFGWILFESGKEYKVLNIDDEEVFLNHTLYANEYNSFPINWVLEKFKLKDNVKRKD
jgi:hypothetical protein